MDLFGNKRPVQIEADEWWYNGRIIQKQNDSRLSKWISFEDNNSCFVVVHTSKKEAVKHCKENPCVKPNNKAKDYI